MDNKKYLNTLIVCGKITIEDKDMYNRLCNSLIDISIILRLFFEYKKTEDIFYILKSLNLMIKDSKSKTDLINMYTKLVDVSSIWLKYDIVDTIGKSIGFNLYTSINDRKNKRKEINSSVVEDILKNLSRIHLRNLDMCKIVIDGIRYKIEASNIYGLILKDALGNIKDFGGKVGMIELSLDKVSVVEINNDIKFTKDIKKIFAENRKCIYIVKTLW